MRRVGFLLKVRPDKIEEYKAHHKTVGPEMLDALRRTGWHNYSLFMRGDGLLFGYLDAREFSSGSGRNEQGRDQRQVARVHGPPSLRT
jgi:L-rhamnose mutarotase